MSDQDAPGRKPKPRDYAVALEYPETTEFPRVLMTGAGEVAHAMIRQANESGVPVKTDEKLAAMLSEAKAGEEIVSPETYRIIAEVLCFLYQTDREWAAVGKKV